jgi:hypothetical protein
MHEVAISDIELFSARLINVVNIIIINTHTSIHTHIVIHTAPTPTHTHTHNVMHMHTAPPKKRLRASQMMSHQMSWYLLIVNLK